jgi:hypothetical protein
MSSSALSKAPRIYRCIQFPDLTSAIVSWRNGLVTLTWHTYDFPWTRITYNWAGITFKHPSMIEIWHRYDAMSMYSLATCLAWGRTLRGTNHLSRTQRPESMGQGHQVHACVYLQKKRTLPSIASVTTDFSPNVSMHNAFNVGITSCDWQKAHTTAGALTKKHPGRKLWWTSSYIHMQL